MRLRSDAQRCAERRRTGAVRSSARLGAYHIAAVRWDVRYPKPRPPHQKLITLDSETRLASLIGSMNDAFKLLRSASVTPRATEQAPQTNTGTFALTTLSISSGSGGKPTP